MGLGGGDLDVSSNMGGSRRGDNNEDNRWAENYSPTYDPSASIRSNRRWSELPTPEGSRRGFAYTSEGPGGQHSLLNYQQQSQNQQSTSSTQSQSVQQQFSMQQPPGPPPPSQSLSSSQFQLSPGSSNASINSRRTSLDQSGRNAPLLTRSGSTSGMPAHLLPSTTTYHYGLQALSEEASNRQENTRNPFLDPQQQQQQQQSQQQQQQNYPSPSLSSLNLSQSSSSNPSSYIYNRQESIPLPPLLRSNSLSSSSDTTVNRSIRPAPRSSLSSISQQQSQNNAQINAQQQTQQQQYPQHHQQQQQQQQQLQPQQYQQHQQHQQQQQQQQYQYQNQQLQQQHHQPQQQLQRSLPLPAPVSPRSSNITSRSSHSRGLSQHQLLNQSHQQQLQPSRSLPLAPPPLPLLERRTSSLDQLMSTVSGEILSNQINSSSINSSSNLSPNRRASGTGNYRSMRSTPPSIEIENLFLSAFCPRISSPPLLSPSFSSGAGGSSTSPSISHSNVRSPPQQVSSLTSQQRNRINSAYRRFCTALMRGLEVTGKGRTERVSWSREERSRLDAEPECCGGLLECTSPLLFSSLVVVDVETKVYFFFFFLRLGYGELFDETDTGGRTTTGQPIFNEIQTIGFISVDKAWEYLSSISTLGSLLDQPEIYAESILVGDDLRDNSGISSGASRISENVRCEIGYGLIIKEMCLSSVRDVLNQSEKMRGYQLGGGGGGNIGGGGTSNTRFSGQGNYSWNQ